MAGISIFSVPKGSGHEKGPFRFNLKGSWEGPPEVFKSVIELPFPKSIRHMPHVAVQVTFHPI
jgi:hypothetical protein